MTLIPFLAHLYHSFYELFSLICTIQCLTSASTQSMPLQTYTCSFHKFPMPKWPQSQNSHIFHLFILQTEHNSVSSLGCCISFGLLMGHSAHITNKITDQWYFSLCNPNLPHTPLPTPFVVHTKSRSSLSTKVIGCTTLGYTRYIAGRR